MILANERAEKLSAYLTADVERAKALITMSPAEAVAKINADGYDFTVEEIEEFGKCLKSAASRSKDGELFEEELGDVAGGIGPVTGALIALGAGILVGGMDRFKIW